MRNRRQKYVFVFLFHFCLKELLLLRDIYKNDNLEYLFEDIHSLIDVGINNVINMNFLDFLITLEVRLSRFLHDLANYVLKAFL